MASFLKNTFGGAKQKFKEKAAGPREDNFKKAPEQELFTKTDPSIDGEDCLHDCETCTIKYPRKWDVDEDSKLYGGVDAWSTHMLVATGKADWVRDVADEKGSVMEAIERCGVSPSNGKMKLSASNMCLPDHHTTHAEGTTVLLLPSFTFVDNVTPSNVPELITSVVNHAPTNLTPLPASISSPYPDPLPAGLRLRACNHSALILLCSQGTRDARCGQSAPLLKREFERHLRPLGQFRDLDDHRPGGVGIYFISHVGGHKFSANVIIYRRTEGGEANQCIWLARVRPEDCENILRYTVKEGKVLKPASQLRGGFDRERQLTSW